MSKAHPEKPDSVRWMAICAYDGSDFAGWQSQPGERSVQDVIEARLGRIAELPVRIHGSGRTDAGVHAKAQVFHFDLRWRHGAQRLLAAMRVGLPPSLQICSVREKRPDFHARFDVVRKRYEYRIFLGNPDPFIRRFVWGLDRPEPLDFNAMHAAVRHLRGRHDFAAFSALNGSDRDDTVRRLDRLEIHRKGRNLRIVAEADGFLYKMVRTLVGALVAVGTGKATPGRIRQMLVDGLRPPEVETAPPQGLCLMKVWYPLSAKGPGKRP
ncbi:MAG: tRNA pseudouridine(38-40) synthase TruA [Bryobacterales bacterium]|nr:tRNA pseudouridine(38-40) synthase TruA [Bryobacterales bacterium]